MNEWNVVVTVPNDLFNEAEAFLRGFGEVTRTGFYNVLTMRVEDIEKLLESLAGSLQDGRSKLIAHLAPAQRAFVFQTPDEFEEQAKNIARTWLPQLAGCRFHVRMHRRGFKGKLDSRHEERFLGADLVDFLERQGTPAGIDFDDPDVILAVDTVNHRAGMSLWTREQLRRYPFLNPG